MGGASVAFDDDAIAYFDRVAVTNPIGGGDKGAINDFIVQLKADGLWAGLTAGWIGRSQYNAGTGTILYELKSNTNNGTIENTAWSTDGQVYNAASDRVTTPLSHTMNTNFSACCVFKDSASDTGINRFIIGLTSGAAILGLSDANKASTPYATFTSSGAGVSNSGDVTAFNCATVVAQVFLEGLSDFGYYRNGAADGHLNANTAPNTGSVLLGDANGSPWGSPSDGVISLVLIYQGTTFNATQASNLYNNVKATVCSGLSLP